MKGHLFFRTKGYKANHMADGCKNQLLINNSIMKNGRFE